MQFKYGLFYLAAIVLVISFGFYLANLKPIQTQSPVDSVTTELLSGKSLTIPQQSGGWQLETEDHSFMALLGFKQIGMQQINLCDQLRSRSKNDRILPIKIGHDWTALKLGIDERIAKGQPAHYGLRNVLLDDASFDIPALEITGIPATESLQVKVKSPLSQYYIADGAYAGVKAVKQKQVVDFEKEAWLLWHNSTDVKTNKAWLGDHALKIKRLNFPYCDLGVLQIKVYLADSIEMNKQSTWPLYQIPNPLDGEKQFKVVKIAAGTTQLSPQIKPKTEDGALFNRLLNTGLVRLGKNKQIMSAPNDLARIKAVAPELLVDKQLAQQFSNIVWDKETVSAQADFYGQQAGPYVRAQIKRFNQERLMGALRLKAFNDKAQRLINNQEPEWQATALGYKLEMDANMPLFASSLFKQIPTQWMPWQRVKNWPKQVGSQSALLFETTLNQVAKGKERFEILTMGQHITVKGAKVVKSEWRCLKQNCSEEQALARWMLLELKQGTDKLSINMQPQQGEKLAKLYRSEFRHIVLDKQGGLNWRYMNGKIRTEKQTDVAIVDRNGQALWRDGKLQVLASEAGLAALIGVSNQHESSLAGMLSRLNSAQVDAKVTLDLRMQKIAQQVLEQGVEKVSLAFKGKDKYQHERSAAFLVMDADNGEILAMAGLPVIPKYKAWQDVLGFDTMQTAQSPLRVRAIQQLGNNHNHPGSTFKLITSLLLEQQAKKTPTIDTLLSGVSIKQLNKLGSENGYSFTAEAGCYPAIYEPYSKNCFWGKHKGGKYKNKPVINNFGIKGKFYETPKREMRNHNETQYGLEQALRDSLNTWYVWMYEMTDQTLLLQGDVAGVPDTRALITGALDQVRPINKLMRSVGFGQALDLSGGLLPVDFDWRVWDVLRSSSTQEEAVTDRHTLRQMSIGLRSYVIPLNMALVSASIASEHWVRPTLLAELNQQAANVDDFLPLNIRTDRIRAGMKRVPQDGSAKNAFKGKNNAWLREFLYAKTGTAPVKLIKHKVVVDEVNTAWITGWLEAGAIAKEKRRLAFVCQVTHSHKTGGASCGPVVQQFFSGLKNIDQLKSKIKVQELGV